MSNAKISSATAIFYNILPIVLAAGILWVGNSIHIQSAKIATIVTDIQHMKKSVDDLSKSNDGLWKMIYEGRESTYARDARINQLEKRVNEISKYLLNGKGKLHDYNSKSEPK